MFASYKGATKANDVDYLQAEIARQLAENERLAVESAERSNMVGAAGDAIGGYNRYMDKQNGGAGKTPIADALRKLGGGSAATTPAMVDEATGTMTMTNEATPMASPSQPIATGPSTLGGGAPAPSEADFFSQHNNVNYDRDLQASTGAAKPFADTKSDLSTALRDMGAPEEVTAGIQDFGVEGVADVTGVEGADALASGADALDGADALAGGADALEGADALASGTDAAGGAGGALGYVGMAKGVAEGDVGAVAKAALSKYLSALGPWGMAASAVLSILG